jgi:uncharacterized surface protein with fasciclin (FAS1) repeats
MAVKQKTQTIVDLARGNDNLSMLVKALKAADMVETLTGNGPFTVFAPTNEAFNRLPKSQREDLFKSEHKNRLQNILRRHVMKGRQMAKDVKTKSSLTPMGGNALKIKTQDNRVKIDEATIQQADLEAKNGVVHLIDRVLMPS